MRAAARHLAGSPRFGLWDCDRVDQDELLPVVAERARQNLLAHSAGGPPRQPVEDPDPPDAEAKRAIAAGSVEVWRNTDLQQGVRSEDLQEEKRTHRA
ncbi:MAG: hypothetical protein GY906_37790 [bacterium]|nr:hypothetical protein [bacterium]